MSKIDKLNTGIIIKMLLDNKSWKIRHEGTNLEDMIHVDGWRYFTNCSCVCIRNDGNILYEYHPNFLIWPLFAFLGAMNVRKVKRTNRER